MAIDVTDRDRTVAIPAHIHRRRGQGLVALGVFQLWLWGTRIVNLLGDAADFSTAFVGVHLGLYTLAIVAGLLLAGLGWRQWREGAGTGRP